MVYYKAISVQNLNFEDHRFSC